MNNMNQQDDLNILTEIFASFPQIKAVYLFGSAASGRTHNESDIDLAIVADNELHLKKIEILTLLAMKGFCEVDIVFLEQMDIIMLYEAVFRNIIIYRTADFDAGYYYSKILRRYFDFYPYLRVQREAYKRRILLD